MSDWLALIIAVALLAANAFFVAGEFAVTSTRSSQIEPLAAQGKRGTKAALW
ncbi:CNNM domain-containing protein, partial [Varibaculum cambriense]